VLSQERIQNGFRICSRQFCSGIANDSTLRLLTLCSAVTCAFFTHGISAGTFTVIPVNLMTDTLPKRSMSLSYVILNFSLFVGRTFRLPRSGMPSKYGPSPGSGLEKILVFQATQPTCDTQIQLEPYIQTNR